MTFKIRKGTVEDCPLIVEFIKELAEFEKLSHECKTTVELVRKSAFPSSGDRPLIFTLIAEEDGRPAGFCLYFYNYSTFTGCAGVYLEDLFVRESFRKRGLGGMFFGRLKAIAVEEKCTRLEWAVIDWNSSARDFYTKKIGATEKTEWVINRLEGDGLLPSAK